MYYLSRCLARLTNPKWLTYCTFKWREKISCWTSVCLVFYSKQMATGARQCLSTGHRKQQDFRLWILPLWTLAAQIKSSASISGQCASCKVVSRDVSGRTLRLLNWQLTTSATLYIWVLRTILALWQDIYCAFRPSSRHRSKLEWMFEIYISKLVKQESLLCVVDAWLKAWCISRLTIV